MERQTARQSAATLTPGLFGDQERKTLPPLEKILKSASPADADNDIRRRRNEMVQAALHCAESKKYPCPGNAETQELCAICRAIDILKP